MIIVRKDKTKIVNFDNLIQIYITQDEEETANFIRYESVDSLYEDLGEYKTEERAKEVLQEIYTYKAMFEFYKSNPMDKELHEEIVNDLDKDNVLFDVYEMPEV